MSDDDVRRVPVKSDGAPLCSPPLAEGVAGVGSASPAGSPPISAAMVDLASGLWPFFKMRFRAFEPGRLSPYAIDVSDFADTTPGGLVGFTPVRPGCIRVDVASFMSLASNTCYPESPPL